MASNAARSPVSARRKIRKHLKDKRFSYENDLINSNETFDLAIRRHLNSVGLIRTRSYKRILKIKNITKFNKNHSDILDSIKKSASKALAASNMAAL